MLHVDTAHVKTSLLCSLSCPLPSVSEDVRWPVHRTPPDIFLHRHTFTQVPCNKWSLVSSDSTQILPSTQTEMCPVIRFITWLCPWLPHQPDLCTISSSHYILMWGARWPCGQLASYSVYSYTWAGSSSVMLTSALLPSSPTSALDSISRLSHSRYSGFFHGLIFHS